MTSALLLLSWLTASAAPTAEPVGGWLRDQIQTAEANCRDSQGKEDESGRLLQEALELSARAAPEDLEGRSVARQAEFKARSALAKNRLWHERSCKRADNLDRAALSVPKGDGWSLPVFVQGDVKVETERGAAPWDGKSALTPGQTLATGKDGYAEMVFPGGARMRLGPDSKFTVAKDMSVFEKGRFYYEKTKQFLQHPEQEALKNKYGYGGCDHCAVVVRGTRFALLIDPKGPSNLALMDGEVALVDAKAGKETVIHAGQQIKFKGAEILRGPEPLDAERFQK